MVLTAVGFKFDVSFLLLATRLESGPRSAKLSQYKFQVYRHKYRKQTGTGGDRWIVSRRWYVAVVCKDVGECGRE